MAKPLDEVNNEVKTLPLSEMHSWFEGESSKAPKEVEIMITDLEKKFGVAISAVTIKNMERVLNLQASLTKLEEELYSETAIAAMDNEQKMQAAQDLNKTIFATLEFTRKFASQNQDMFKKGAENSDAVAALLRALPADKIAVIKEKLEKGEI